MTAEKKPYLAYSRSGACIEPMGRMTRALDPEGVLSPVRILSI